MSSQKVLFLSGTTQGFGGLEIVLLDWLSGIDYQNTAVTVASYHTGDLSQMLAKNGLPVKCIDLPPADAGSFWKALPKWISFYRGEGATKMVFLEGGIPDFDLTPIFVGFCFCMGNIYTFESTSPEPLLKQSRTHFGFMPGFGLWRYKRILDYRIRGRLARRTFTASCGTRDKMNAYLGYPVRRTTVLYHGVDTARFCPSPSIRTEFRRAHGIPDDATVIVSHGRLAPNKRIDRIIRAFDLLSAKRDNLWLLLSAHGPALREIEEAVGRSPARARVKLVEFREDVSAMIQGGDIYVLASDREGFGIALVEAMSAGLVCVATRVTGPPEIVTDGKDGFLVEPSDEDVLDGLRRAVGLDADARESICREARRTVLEKFDLRNGVQKALESFQIPSRYATAAGISG